MAKVLSSISRDAPASPVEANVSDTFAFSGTPTFSGGGGVQRYDFKWQVDGGGGYVTIGASGTGLITADTNPVSNTNSQSQHSITVTCDEAGTYTVRMAGAPTSGGSYTVLSATQTVTVSEVAGTDDLLADDLTVSAPTLTSAALGQTHALLADDIAAGAPTLTSAALGQIHALLADEVAAGTPTLSTPALAEAAEADDLLADDLTVGTPTLTSPELGQTHILLAGDIILGLPTLSEATIEYSGGEEENTSSTFGFSVRKRKRKRASVARAHMIEEMLRNRKRGRRANR